MATVIEIKGEKERRVKEDVPKVVREVHSALSRGDKFVILTVLTGPDRTTERDAAFIAADISGAVAV